MQTQRRRTAADPLPLPLPLPLPQRHCGRLLGSLLALDSSSHQQRRVQCSLLLRSIRRGEVETATERRQQRDEPTEADGSESDGPPLPIRWARMSAVPSPSRCGWSLRWEWADAAAAAVVVVVRCCSQPSLIVVV